jgi:hypothetical protein
MSIETDASQDRAVGLRRSTPWHVVDVTALPDYTISVTFSDGVAGFVHLSGIINSDKAGVFAALRDDAVFKKVYLEHGAVTWPGELDIAPDAMYDEIKARGEWVLD